jgi:hypothetical protein
MRFGCRQFEGALKIVNVLGPVRSAVLSNDGQALRLMGNYAMGLYILLVRPQAPLAVDD